MKRLFKNISIEKVYTGYILVILAVFSVLTLKKCYVFYCDNIIEQTSEEDIYETVMKMNFYGEFGFVNLNGAVKNLLHEQEMNGVVKLNNGYLATLSPAVSEEKLLEEAHAVGNINEWLEKQDIPFVYVMAPYVVSKYNPCLPIGCVEYGNQNADIFLDDLKELGVDYIDLREEMYKDGLNQYDLWYRTDHHWTTEGGFYAFTKIAERLETLLGIDIDDKVTNIDYYSINKYKKWYLGSNGRRTGIYFAGVDDFDVILPMFDTKLRNASGEVGTMEELIIDYGVLQERHYEAQWTYDVAYYASFGDYENLNCDNDKKILIICDSMGEVVNPYLFMSFSEVHTIRAYDAELLTTEYLEKYQPDVVIMMHIVSNLNKPEIFSFGM